MVRGKSGVCVIKVQKRVASKKDCWLSPSLLLLTSFCTGGKNKSEEPPPHPSDKNYFFKPLKYFIKLTTVL